MPIYQLNPLGRNRLQASPGLPAYLLGSLNRLVAPTKMNVTSGAVATNVGTITGYVKEGNAPTVGQLLYISGASAAYFNVNGATILTVSAAHVPDDGIYTLTFALTHADVTVSTLTGDAIAPQIEIGETVVAGDSIAAALQTNTGPENPENPRFDVSFPTLPTSCTVDAYSASIDVDSEYTLLTNVATVTGSTLSGGSIIFNGLTANFVRFHVSGVVGSGKIIAKVTV